MKTAADALDAIRQGGTQMVTNAHARIADCRRHLDQGEFNAALEAANQLVDRLAHLGHAQARLGALDGSILLRASELEVGMKTDGGATVTAIDDCPCGLESCEKVMVTFDNGVQQHMMPEWELVVAAA